ncbi:MAG: YraN family protein [Anaerolineaceae bacterium]|nr:YraN family protein [Anaerolineaceae bacterium]
MAFRQKIGSWGEAEAARYLEAKGMCILARNTRTPYGEIDLVGQMNGFIVMIEVKTRQNEAYGMPEESITPLKKQHMVNSAMHFLQEHPELGEDWRVDVVAIRRNSHSELEIVWFEDVIHD